MRSVGSVDFGERAASGAPAVGSALAIGALLDEIVDRVAERLVQKLEERERRWTPRQDHCELLSVAEAAEMLRCKPQRVYDLRSSGRLPRTTEGGRAVVRRADVERLVDEG
jgi:excisionase family DNA binding protein